MNDDVYKLPLGLLKIEQISDMALSVCAKSYITCNYESLQQVHELAAILDAHGFLHGNAAAVMLNDDDFEHHMKIALKGVRNTADISVFDFLNVILGVSRTYTTNRGIRKELGTSHLATYELEKEVKK